MPKRKKTTRLHHVKSGKKTASKKESLKKHHVRGSGPRKPANSRQAEFSLKMREKLSYNWVELKKGTKK